MLNDTMMIAPATNLCRYTSLKGCISDCTHNCAQQNSAQKEGKFYCHFTKIKDCGAAIHLPRLQKKRCNM